MDDGGKHDDVTLIAGGRRSVEIGADGRISWPVEDDDMEDSGHAFVSVGADGRVEMLGHRMTDEMAQVRLSDHALTDDELDEDELDAEAEEAGAAEALVQGSEGSPEVFALKTQCKPNVQLGYDKSTVQLCAEAAAANSACNVGTFMYPVRSLWQSWGCRCCKDTSVNSAHSSWNMYKIPSAEAVPETTATTTTAASAVSIRRRRTAPWPADDATVCGQETKQKSIYAYFDYAPTIASKPATDIRTSVAWEDVANAPWRMLDSERYRGGVYASYVIRTPNNGPAGYFGAQLLGSTDSMFLFSMWDADRWSGSGHDKTPKASSMLSWPLSSNCKRNCNDCGLASLKPLVDQGLTSGTKCVLKHSDMDKLGKFSLRFYRKAESYTINTADYEGFGAGHQEIGETDRQVTGSRWVLEATNEAGVTLEVGDILFEGATEISRLTMFDELIGCTKCNDQFHRDTRQGPFLHDADGTVRKPTSMEVQINGPSSCDQYQVSGDASSHSVTFEAGPGAVPNFQRGVRHTVW